MPFKTESSSQLPARPSKLKPPIAHANPPDPPRRPPAPSLCARPGHHPPWLRRRPSGAALHTGEVTLEPTSQTATPDADGHFSLEGVAPGTYTLIVKAPGFATASIPVTVSAATPLDLPAILLRVATVTSGVDVTAPLSQAEIATAQIHDEEQQRILGVIPNFFVTYDSQPVPLTARQKFALSFRTVIDPSSFIITGIIAGAEQATNTYPAYGPEFTGWSAIRLGEI